MRKREALNPFFIAQQVVTEQYLAVNVFFRKQIFLIVRNIETVLLIVKHALLINWNLFFAVRTLGLIVKNFTKLEIIKFCSRIILKSSLSVSALSRVIFEIFPFLSASNFLKYSIKNYSSESLSLSTRPLLTKVAL